MGPVTRIEMVSALFHRTLARADKLPLAPVAYETLTRIQVTYPICILLYHVLNYNCFSGALRRG